MLHEENTIHIKNQYAEFWREFKFKDPIQEDKKEV